MSIGRLFLTRIHMFMIKMYPYNTIDIDADSSIISEVAMRQILDIIEDTNKILSDPLNDIRRPMWLNILDKNSRRINIPHIVIEKNDVEEVKELIPYLRYLNLSPEDEEFLAMTDQPETMR